MKTQQMDLYAAERTVDEGVHFGAIDHVQEFVDSLREKPWFEEQYGTLVKMIEVGPARNGGKNGSLGWYESANAAGRIEMAPRHWNVRTVLHELSHVLASALHESQSHDPYFARIYLELVYRVMGSDAFVALRAAFTDHNIVHDPKGDN